MRNQDTARLVTKPAVHVIGQTTFNREGMTKWAEHRGFMDNEAFLTSPLHSLMNGGSLLTNDHAETEFMSEFGGRFCYNSFMKGRESGDYIANITESGHGSVMEHGTFNLAIDGVSRSLSHELIRHRAGFAISEESQRYVDAMHIRFVVPPILVHMWNGDMECFEAQAWLEHRMADLEEYKALQEYICSDEDLARLKSSADYKTMTSLKKRANEAARSVLPNAAETRLFWTGNLRSLRHFCELRGAEGADLEIRRLATAMAETLMDLAPYTFADFETREGAFGVGEVNAQHRKV